MDERNKYRDNLDPDNPQNSRLSAGENDQDQDAHVDSENKNEDSHLSPASDPNNFTMNNSNEFNSNDYQLYDSEEEIAEDRRKKILIISISLAALLLLVFLVVSVRACQTFGKNKDNIFFEKQDKNESIDLSKRDEITISTKDMKPDVTIREEATGHNRPSALPALTTVSGTTSPTTSHKVSIHEGGILETTRAAVITSAATSPASTKEIPSATSSRSTTSSSTTTKSESTTKANVTTSQEQSSGDGELDEEIEIFWPEAYPPNPQLPEIMETLVEGKVVSPDGRQAGANNSDKKAIDITDKQGNTSTISNLDKIVDKVLAVSEKFVFYQSDKDFYRLNIDDESVQQITISEESLIKDAIYTTDMNNNLVFWNNSNLSIIEENKNELVVISREASDIKLQGNVLAFANNSKEINFLDLSDEIIVDKIKTIPENNISAYALTTDGSALYFQKDQNIYIYKTNTYYLISKEAESFLLSNNPEIIIVYTKDSRLEINRVRANNSRVENVYEKIDPKTINENKILNYNGNYKYADTNKFILEYIDGSSESVTLP